MGTAVSEYVREGYREINRKLRFGQSHQLVPQIIEELKTFENYTGTVYRGLTLDKSEISETFMVGKIYRDRGFMSTSISKDESQKFNCLGVPLSRTEERSITLIIESKTGKDIPVENLQYGECEILFPPLTGFEVVSIEVDSWEEYTIYLKEV